MGRYGTVSENTEATGSREGREGSLTTTRWDGTRYGQLKNSRRRQIVIAYTPPPPPPAGGDIVTAVPTTTPTSRERQPSPPSPSPLPPPPPPAASDKKKTHLVDILLLSCPLVGVVVPAPVLHLPLLHDYDVGAHTVQEVLRMQPASPQTHKQEEGYEDTLHF